MYKYCQELRLNPETCNVGKKWESYEDELLVKLVNENKSCKKIATEFKRTECSIRERIIEKIILPEYNDENITKLAKKFDYNIEYLEKCNKKRKEKYEERMIKFKEKKLNKSIENEGIKTIDSEIYYKLLLNIVERIEKKIDGYEFT